MTRKDYTVVAEIIAKLVLNEKMGGKIESAKHQIDNILQQTNPNYSSEKFWYAVEESVAEDMQRYAE